MFLEYNGVKHTYVLDGTNIVKETWGSNSLVPLYDLDGTVCGIQYNGVAYYFYKNLQGDVIAITDNTGTVVANYRYDAWGACTILGDSSCEEIAKINPFRYRGYYYDTLLAILSRFIRKKEEMTIRLLSVSGECMTEGMAKNIRQAFPNAEIYCGYGLSEASPRVAYLPAELLDQNPTCAGLPLESVKIRIIRENGQDAAIGEIGEVLVKGPNVMIGYFDDPVRTKTVVKNGWLHTGDLGLLKRDGMLTIKGRKDDMIIRAGMNIYPAEIENALSSNPKIREVQAYGYEKSGTQEIGLLISGDFSSIDEVMQICRESLPSYQLPSKIELAEETEILTGGKRKRKRQ